MPSFAPLFLIDKRDISMASSHVHLHHAAMFSTRAYAPTILPELPCTLPRAFCGLLVWLHALLLPPASACATGQCITTTFTCMRQHVRAGASLLIMAQVGTTLCLMRPAVMGSGLCPHLAWGTHALVAYTLLSAWGKHMELI